MVMTVEQRAIVGTAIQADFNNRSRAISPISMKRMLRSVRNVIGDGPSDDELIEMVADRAIQFGIAIEFDIRA
jgi:hypothetical protein